MDCRGGLLISRWFPRESGGIRRGDNHEYTDSHWPKSRRSSAGPRRSRWPCRAKGLHRRGLGQARAVHGAARAGPRLRGSRRVPRGQRGQARGVLGAYHDHSGSNGRPPGHRAGGRRLRRRPHRVGSARGPPLLIGNSRRRCSTMARPGARLVFSCGYHITRDGQDVYSWKVKVLVHVAGRLARLFRLVDLDDQVEACRAGLRQRHAVDCRARQRPGGGRAAGPAGVEPTCGRPDPREQPHPSGGLRPVHGGGPRERRAGS